MPIITEQVTASAELNDQYGVTVWQAKKTMPYTLDEARQLAAEILAACDEAQSCLDEDAESAFSSHDTSPFDVAPGPERPKPGPTGRGRNSKY
jgi:hypothetical protein